MKLQEALNIIENKSGGYMVSFEVQEGGTYRSDHFPDKHAGEDLIKTEEGAWELARKFADATGQLIGNIYVIGDDFVPVEGYSDKKLKKLY